MDLSRIKQYFGFNRKSWLAIFWDLLLWNLAYFGALWIRFDFRYSTIPYELSLKMLPLAPLFSLVALVLFAFCKLYSSMWSYATLRDFLRIPLACLLAVLTHFMVERGVRTGYWIPNGYFLIEFFLSVIFIAGHRFVYQIFHLVKRSLQGSDQHSMQIPTMVIGAGEAGRSIVHEMNGSGRVPNRVVALIDDNPSKLGKILEGVRVFGGRDQIKKVVDQEGIQEIVLAIPSIDHNEQKEILDICQETNCRLKILPGMYQIINGEVSVSKLRDVNIEDLLGREPVTINSDEIAFYVHNKTVLVTGGGGTIGSEICRQVASFAPKKLIVFDIYENNAYALQMELQRKYPQLNLAVLIGSVRNLDRLQAIFREEKPDIVYHAAAHKHVPLMEVSPNEAVKNNVFGTLNTAMAADAAGVKRFVLISTDKAVNPTNVMGATKRMCEMIIQSYNSRSKTDFVAVRFGNVLGSSGSVIPLFKKEIEEGGPVTVTHPDIVRYFMTIPEAVSLVLQTGVYARGGEIFILDMGKPVKILDMAKKLIRLSGYRPMEDIPIVFTGLRPGEKLYEEVLMAEEGLQMTPNRRIKIGEPIDFDEQAFLDALPALKEAAYEEVDNIRDLISKLVPTFKVSVNGIPEDYEAYRQGQEARQAQEQKS